MIKKLEMYSLENEKLKSLLNSKKQSAIIDYIISLKTKQLLLEELFKLYELRSSLKLVSYGLGNFKIKMRKYEYLKSLLDMDMQRLQITLLDVLDSLRDLVKYGYGK